MTLFCTPTSPYARVARVAVIELGLAAEVSVETVSVRDPESPLLAFSPVGRVPTLVTAGGAVLTETRSICEYLSRRSAQSDFVADVEDLPGRGFEGLAEGFLEGIVTWVREQRRPADAQSPAVLALERARADRCLDHFEERGGARAPEPHFGTVVLASALGLSDMRLTWAWRAGRPVLTAWYDAFEKRPSLRETAPVEHTR